MIFVFGSNEVWKKPEIFQPKIILWYEEIPQSYESQNLIIFLVFNTLWRRLLQSVFRLQIDLDNQILLITSFFSNTDTIFPE